MTARAPLIDIHGQRFGKWKVIGRSKGDKRGAVWICICDCGTTRRVRGRELRRGNSTNCGCWRRS